MLMVSLVPLMQSAKTYSFMPKRKENHSHETFPLRLRAPLVPLLYSAKLLIYEKRKINSHEVVPSRLMPHGSIGSAPVLIQNLFIYAKKKTKISLGCPFKADCTAGSTAVLNENLCIYAKKKGKQFL
jgi:hypothetical protein